MKRIGMLILMFLVLLVSVSQIEASGWVRWDANEFPENFDESGVFVNLGSGTREIINESQSPNIPEYVMECRNLSPDRGNWHYTISDVWTDDQNSTVEIRLRVDNYCAQIGQCADPNSKNAVGVVIRSKNPDHVVGFYWSLVGGLGGIERITAVETSNTYVDFPNQKRYFTYRLFYDAVLGEAHLYYWDEAAQQWDYLLTSVGYLGSVTQAGLYVGDWSNTSMSGIYRIDYQQWRNDGFITEPEYCGDTGTVYKTGDLNKDCIVNFVDYGLFAEQWLECTYPGKSNCQ